MTALTTPTFPAVVFSVTDAGIAELEAKHRGLVVAHGDKKGYLALTQAIAEVRTARTDVEKRRKELKQDALDSGPRDVTPVTRTAATLERIRQSKQEPAPEPQPDNTAMEACLDAIARCGDLDQLRAAAKGFPAALTDDQKAKVAAAYAERKACLESAASDAPVQSQDDFDA